MFCITISDCSSSLAVQNSFDFTDAPEDDGTPKGMFVEYNTLNTQALAAICGHRCKGSSCPLPSSELDLLTSIHLLTYPVLACSVIVR